MQCHAVLCCSVCAATEAIRTTYVGQTQAHSGRRRNRVSASNITILHLWHVRCLSHAGLAIFSAQLLASWRGQWIRLVVHGNAIISGCNPCRSSLGRELLLGKGVFP